MYGIVLSKHHQAAGTDVSFGNEIRSDAGDVKVASVEQARSGGFGSVCDVGQKGPDGLGTVDQRLQVGCAEHGYTCSRKGIVHSFEAVVYGDDVEDCVGVAVILRRKPKDLLQVWTIQTR